MIDMWSVSQTAYFARNC